MSPINILIAEDHRLFRQILIPALKEYDIHTIGEASNGQELINLLKVKRPDVILLDLEMPIMNGCATLEKILEIYPDQKVVVLTQHDNEILHHYVCSRGAKAFLTKNTDPEILGSTIRMVHENKILAKMELLWSTEISEIKFSKREAELIPLICEGKSNKEIADQLKIGNKTVEAHKKSLFRKTNTMGAVEFVAYLFKRGLNNLR